MLYGSQHSGQAWTRSVTLSWQGPPASRQQEENAMVQHVTNFSTARFVLVSFSTCGFRCRKDSACLLENRAVETWNSFNTSSVCFCFEGLGSGVTSSSRGDHQRNRNLYLINWAPRKERIVQNLLLSPLLSVSWLFLLVSFYSLWLVLNRGGGNHDLAGLQRVVAAPPGLPEDALLPLVPILGRGALEVSTV